MGWVKIDRQIFDHWLWQKKPFSIGQAWVDLILLASHKDGVHYYRGTLQERKRGEVCASLKWLGERWGWSPNKVGRFLDVLEKDKMITQERDGNGTAVTIENYSIFQDGQNANGTQTERRRNADGTPTETIKKVKEGKELSSLADDLDFITDEQAERALESLRARNRKRKERNQ